MDKTAKDIVKHPLRFGVALVYFSVNVLLSHATESNFWSQRRSAARKMSENGAVAEAMAAPTYSEASGKISSEQYQLLAHLPQTAPLHFGVVTQGTANRGRGTDPNSDISPPSAQNLMTQGVLPYGSIQEMYLSPVPNAPLVIHIQDAHGIEEAQRNISSIMGTLVENQRVNLVGLEGASGSFSMAPYRNYPDASVTKDVAEFFLKKGLIAGPEYAGLTLPKPPAFYGVEEGILYEGNVQALKTAFAARANAQTALTGLSSEAERFKKTFFSEALKTCDRHFLLYKADHEKLGHHVRYLTQAIKGRDDQLAIPNIRRLTDALDREETLDFKAVESERRRLVEVLVQRLAPANLQELVAKSVDYRAGRMGYGDYYQHLRQICVNNRIKLADFGQMESYIRYVSLAEKIDRNKLLGEMDLLERSVQDALATTPEEKELMSISRDLVLLEKLLKHEMAMTDWQTYQTRRPDILALRDRLAPFDPALATRSTLTAETLKPFEDFCDLAVRRNTALVGNLLTEMKKNGAPFGMLVAGGFHSEGVTKLLREKQVSFVVVTPKITKIPTNNNYLDVLAKDPVPLEKQLAGDRIYLSKPIALTGGETANEIEGTNRVLQTSENIFQVAAGLSVTTNPDLGKVVGQYTIGNRVVYLVRNYTGGSTLFAWASNLAKAIRGALGRFRQDLANTPRPQPSPGNFSMASPAATISSMMPFYRWVARMFEGKEKWRKLTDEDQLDLVIRRYAPIVETTLFGVIYSGSLILLGAVGMDLSVWQSTGLWGAMNGAFALLHQSVYMPENGRWVQKSLRQAGPWIVVKLLGASLLIHMTLLLNLLNPTAIGVTIAFAISGTGLGVILHRIYNNRIAPRLGLPALTGGSGATEEKDRIKRAVELLEKLAKEKRLSDLENAELRNLLKDIDKKKLLQDSRWGILSKQVLDEMAKILWADRGSLGFDNFILKMKFIPGVDSKLGALDWAKIFPLTDSLTLKGPNYKNFIHKQSGKDTTSPPENGIDVTNNYLEGVHLKEVAKTPMEQAEISLERMKLKFPESAQKLDETMVKIRQLEADGQIGDVALLMAGIVDRLTRTSPDRYILHFARDMGLTLAAQEILAQMDGKERRGGALFLNRDMMGTVYHELRGILVAKPMAGQTQEQAVLDWIQRKASDPNNEGFINLLGTTQKTLREMGVFDQDKVLLFDTGLMGTMPWFVLAVVRYTDQIENRPPRDVEILMVSSANETAEISENDLPTNVVQTMDHSLWRLMKDNAKILGILEDTGNHRGHPVHFSQEGDRSSIGEESPENQLLFHYLRAVFMTQAVAWRQLESDSDERMRIRKKLMPTIDDFIRIGLVMDRSKKHFDYSSALLDLKPHIPPPKDFYPEINFSAQLKSWESLSERIVIHSELVAKKQNIFTKALNFLILIAMPLLILMPRDSFLVRFLETLSPDRGSSLTSRIARFFKGMTNASLLTIVLLPLLETLALQALKPSMENWLPLLGVDPTGGMVFLAAGLAFSLIHVLALTVSGERVSATVLAKDILIWTLGGTVFTALLSLDGGFSLSFGLHSLLNHGIGHQWLNKVPLAGRILRFMTRPFSVLDAGSRDVKKIMAFQPLPLALLAAKDGDKVSFFLDNKTPVTGVLRNRESIDQRGVLLLEGDPMEYPVQNLGYYRFETVPAPQTRASRRMAIKDLSDIEKGILEHVLKRYFQRRTATRESFVIIDNVIENNGSRTFMLGDDATPDEEVVPVSRMRTLLVYIDFNNGTYHIAAEKKLGFDAPTLFPSEDTPSVGTTGKFSDGTASFLRNIPEDTLANSRTPMSQLFQKLRETPIDPETLTLFWRQASALSVEDAKTVSDLIEELRATKGFLSSDRQIPSGETSLVLGWWNRWIVGVVLWMGSKVGLAKKRTLSQALIQAEQTIRSRAFAVSGAPLTELIGLPGAAWLGGGSWSAMGGFSILFALVHHLRPPPADLVSRFKSSHGLTKVLFAFQIIASVSAETIKQFGPRQGAWTFKVVTKTDGKRELNLGIGWKFLLQTAAATAINTVSILFGGDSTFLVFATAFVTHAAYNGFVTFFPRLGLPALPVDSRSKSEHTAQQLVKFLETSSLEHNSLEGLARKAAFRQLIDNLNGGPTGSVLPENLKTQLTVGEYWGPTFKGALVELLASPNLNDAVPALPMETPLSSAKTSVNLTNATIDRKSRVTANLIGFDNNNEREAAKAAIQGLLLAGQPVFILVDQPGQAEVTKILKFLDVDPTSPERGLITFHHAIVGQRMSDIEKSVKDADPPLSKIVLTWTEDKTLIVDGEFIQQTFSSIAAAFQNAIETLAAILRAA